MVREAFSIACLTGIALVATCAVFGPSVNASNDPFLGFDGPIYPNPFILTGTTFAWGMLAGDFDEDGFQDLAVVGEAGMRILLGNGDCTFSAADYPVTGFGEEGATGDFNKDGHLDLAFAKTSSNDALVLLGNGDGTFSTPIALTVPGATFGDFAYAVAVADFDGDNNEDVVVAMFDNGPLGFFAGNGDGTFDAPVTTLGSADANLGIGDFDEDGNMDLVSPGGVWLGSGNGMFTPVFFPGPTPALGPHFLGVADFNGDTHLDVARSNWSEDDVSIWLGNGDGTVGPETRYPIGNGPRHLLVHDADGDGNVDLLVELAVSGFDSEDVIAVLPGNGNGTFGPRSQIPLAIGSGFLVVADFDNDGNDDLATHTGFQLFILPGQGNGFAGADPATVKTQDPFGGARAATFGDINKDGFQDLVRIQDVSTNAIRVFIADGAGGFYLTHWSDAGGNDMSGVAIADFNNDTNPDIIVTNTDLDNASILLGTGRGMFAPMVFIPLISGPGAIATGLFNNDVNVDLAVLGTVPSPSVFVLTGNGNTTFSSSGIHAVGTNPVSIHTGDFDENGVVDLVVGNEGSSDLSVLLGIGDGTFQAEVRYAVTTINAFDAPVLSVEDVNDDGHEDLLLWRNEVLYGAGDGTFAAATEVGPGYLGTLRVVDVNGDGRVDLIGGLVSLRLGNGDGTFGEPAYFASGAGFHHAMILDDADGDGRLDVITSGAKIYTLLNVEAAAFNFLNDKITLRWPGVDGALSYNVYRGLLSSLVDVDNDGLPDSGYGDCQNALDPDTTDLNYVDASVPAPGSGYFYLIAVEDGIGERWLGTTSDGLPRVPTLACP